MSFTNYTTFVAALTSFMDNTDADAQVDTFIDLAHARLNRLVRLDEMETMATASTVGGNRWVTKPTGYMGMRRLKITLGTGRVLGLDYVTPGKMDDTPEYNNQGAPAVFTIVSNRIRLGPIPNGVFELEMAYYANVAVLSGSNTTNIFLAQIPDLLLYACMTEAGIWMRDPEMRTYWSAGFNDRYEETKTNDEMGRFPAGQLAMSVV